jgi:hypothetical protein
MNVEFKNIEITNSFITHNLTFITSKKTFNISKDSILKTQNLIPFINKNIFRFQSASSNLRGNVSGTVYPGAVLSSADFRLTLDGIRYFPDTLVVAVTIVPQGCVSSNARIGILEEESYENIVKEEVELLIYPNPYEEQTTIQYSLDSEQTVTINVYNSLGEKVMVLVDKQQKAGLYEYLFSAKDKGYTSGIYLLEAIINNRRKIYKLVEL